MSRMAMPATLAAVLAASPRCGCDDGAASGGAR